MNTHPSSAKAFAIRLYFWPHTSAPSLDKRLGTDLATGVSDVVRRLLTPSADRTWLSQKSDLPRYAEASPDTFLSIVEDDLRSEDPKIDALFLPSDAGIFGDCPRAGLLWALELLAWKPERLLRVVFVLAKLCARRTDDNWTNTPMGTLMSIFRSWIPQTSASVDQRNQALETLTKKFPDVGWQICVDQFDPTSTTGRFTYRPPMAHRRTRRRGGRQWCGGTRQQNQGNRARTRLVDARRAHAWRSGRAS